MQETIALLAPALIALGFYSHLNRDQISTKKLVTSYGLFVVLINLCMYLVTIYLLGHEVVSFGGKAFVKYIIGASAFAFLLPFVVNLSEKMVAVEVKRNAKK